DVSIQAEVLNLLTRLRREHDLTYILVSHDLAVVSHMCERLAVMRLGEVVEDLAIEQLRRHMPTHPYTRQLFQAAHGYNRDFVAQLVDDL
ncbi:MAG: ABC transporter ATP-binding protein, partial [Kiloniellales bacterium]